MDRIRAADCETIGATLVGHGAIDRPAIELPTEVVPADAAHEGSTASGAETDRSRVPVADVLRLDVESSTRHVRFEQYAGGVRATGVFETPEGARDPATGTNLLPGWVEDAALELGRTVHLDVIEPGFAYGLRAPGSSAVYDAPGSPDDSLASIAESLEDGE